MISLSEKKPRGFAAYPPERRSEIARKGGKTAQALGVGHAWNSAQAKEAGRKGGLACAAKKRAARDAALDAPIPFMPVPDRQLPLPLVDDTKEVVDDTKEGKTL